MNDSTPKSKLVHKTLDSTDDPEPDTNSGPNLIVLYMLLGLALLAAMGIAAAIVWPFYLRR